MAPSKENHKERNHARSLSLALILIVLLMCAGVAVSCILSVSLSNSSRTERQRDRAPSCLLAESLIKKEHGESHKADTALYNAMGCPAAVRLR